MHIDFVVAICMVLRATRRTRVIMEQKETGEKKRGSETVLNVNLVTRTNQETQPCLFDLCFSRC